MNDLGRSLAITLCLVTATTAGAQTSTLDVCYSMAQNALHNITVSQTNDAAIAALYSNYCYADGSTNTGSMNASGNAVVNGLPIGAAFAKQDANTRFTQFCKEYQSYSAVSNNQYNYSNLVLAKGLDSVNDCIKAAGSNYTLSYKILTPSSLVVDFTIPGGGTLTINGVTPDKGVTCTGHKYSAPGGGIITYDQGTVQTIGAGAGTGELSCSRAVSYTNNGTDYYSEKSVLVSTNVGNLDIFWPQDAVFPITTASTIQTNINALQGQIKSLQDAVAYDTLPIGSLIPWLSNDPTPAGWTKCDGSDTAHCPDLNGRFLMGTHSGSAGSTGGRATTTEQWMGSNNRQPDGNGFSIDGAHFSSKDRPELPIIPPYTAVVYIMKIANK